MSKDDWPESTEAGELIARAHRKGWIGDARKSHWRVDFVKVGHGHLANFYVTDGGVSQLPGPVFPTPQEVRSWLESRGCWQSNDDPDIWFEP